MTDGVLPNPSTNMQVSAGSGMNVLVEPGFAICAGGLKLEESQRTLAIQAADTTYDRIDTVVLRWNDNDSERICDFYIVSGTPALSPIRPELSRTESVWELGLADLFINAASTEISNQRITDTRYESERCGVISAISKFDTTAIYQQVQADLAGFKETEQADFVAWFSHIKEQLSEDAAGNLQLEIDEIKEVIGETDISGIGNGTISGAISALNGTLTNSMTIRYNETTNYIQVYNNGEWVDAIEATALTGAILCKVIPITLDVASHDWAANGRKYILDFEMGKYKNLDIIAAITMYSYAALSVSYYDALTNAYVALFNNSSSNSSATVSVNSTFTLPETAKGIKVEFAETYGGGTLSISKCHLYTTDSTINPTEYEEFTIG